MRLIAILVGGLGALALALAGWMLRYQPIDIQRADDGVAAYVLDRWTGDLRLIARDRWMAVTEKPSPKTTSDMPK